MTPTVSPVDSHWTVYRFQRLTEMPPRRNRISGKQRAVFQGVVFRSPTFPFLGRRTKKYGLSDR